MFGRGTSLCAGPEVRRVECVQTTYISSTVQCEGRRHKIDTGKVDHSQHKLDLTTRGKIRGLYPKTREVSLRGIT